VTIKTPIATKITLLLTILLVVLYAAVGLNNWLKGSTETDSTLRMDELTNPDTAELQSRINSQLLEATRVNETEIGAADNSAEASAMDARLAGLTKNVTTQVIPSNQQLEDFYLQNKENYREPSKLWVWVVGFSTAIHGGRAFEKAQLALTGKTETPKGDTFDRYGAILSTELAEKYGQGFSAKLLLLAANNDSLPCWAGPISSAQGAQLVCIKKIAWGAYTPLEEIRSQLINDWRFSVAAKS